jgi:hypothetical protein
MGLGCSVPFSKKFLWEELELVQEEVTFICQKLREYLEPAARREALPVPLPHPLTPFPHRGTGE